MKISLIHKVVAPIIFAIFTFTSCHVSGPPYMHTGPSIHDVPVGLGDVGIVFLDASYEMTDTDMGIMAMFVENNEYTENVVLIAEIRDNDKANDIVVRVMNGENKSLTSFFYRSGESFPDRMIMDIDGENVEGRFTFYDSLTETYSVTFFDDTGDNETIRDITLNKSILSLQHDHGNQFSKTGAGGTLIAWKQSEGLQSILQM